MENRRLIIVNRMYAGDFFEEKNNIGGEVINLLHDDNGDNYIWLNPHGKCDPDILKGYDEVYVLLVMRYAPWKWKVLGKSKIDIKESKEIMKKVANETTHEKQNDYIKEKEIRYNGVLYSEITQGNTRHGESIYDKALFLTFKSDKIWVPNIEKPEDFENTIFNIYDEENKTCQTSNDKNSDKKDSSKNKYKKGLTPRPLFMFLHDEKGIKDFKKDDGEGLFDTYNFINNIVGNEGEDSTFMDDGKEKIIKWKELPKNENAKSIKVDDSVFKDYFLKIIREEDRELAFSNMLAYFLRYNDNELLPSFVEKVLGVENFDCENATITREEENIDILISSKSHKIIIENKIKSNLIEKKGGMKNKLDDYFKGQSEEKNEIEEKFKGEHLQTDRYYAYALSQALKNGIKEENVKIFVLVPNYNSSLINAQLEEKKKFESTIKTYYKINDFFSKCQKEIPYLDEFLLAIKKHTKNNDNSIEEETKNNFVKRISRLKSPLS